MALPSNLPQRNYIQGFWKLDETSGTRYDETDNSYDLTDLNTVLYDTGKIGNAAKFQAANSEYLSIADDLGITGGAISISLWVKNLSEISANTYTFALQQDDGVDVYYSIQYVYNGGTRLIVFRRTKCGVAVQGISYTATMGTSDWYHLVLTYDNTNIKGYVNNSLKDTVAASGNGTGTNADAFYIGGFGTANYYASSLIDEVIVWNTALTAAEVSTVYGITEYKYAGGIMNWFFIGNALDKGKKYFKNKGLYLPDDRTSSDRLFKPAII